MSEVLAGGQAPEPRPRPGWGPSCAADIMSSVAAGPLERALEHDGDKDHAGSLPWDYNPQYLQVLFLALLLSSCYGQEYPAKVDICIFSKIRYYDDDVRD